MNGPGSLSTRSRFEPAYLIINADDYGYFKGVSQGILECVRQGTVTATAVSLTQPVKH